MKLFWGIALLVAAVDQLVKFFVVLWLKPIGSIPILGRFLHFSYVENRGAAFGLLSEMESVLHFPFFTAVTIAAGMMIYAYQKFLPPEALGERAALGLIWGGALGNFFDRVRFGFVVDFIDLGWWPVFNVADSCITVGLSILVIAGLHDLRKKKKNA